MSKKIKLIVGILLIVNIITIISNIQYRKQIVELESKIKPTDIETDKLVDSLQTNLFIAISEIGRYEISLEYLYEVNPEAAKEFDEYYNNETE